VINNPTKTTKLLDLGKIHSLSFSKRMASFANAHDPYFVFKDEIQKERKKTYVSFIEADQLEIDKLSKILFT
jgi:hypothetical protein